MKSSSRFVLLIVSSIAQEDWKNGSIRAALHLKRSSRAEKSSQPLLRLEVYCEIENELLSAMKLHMFHLIKWMSWLGLIRIYLIISQFLMDAQYIKELRLKQYLRNSRKLHFHRKSLKIYCNFSERNISYVSRSFARALNWDKICLLLTMLCWKVEGNCFLRWKLKCASTQAWERSWLKDLLNNRGAFLHSSI